MFPAYELHSSPWTDTSVVKCTFFGVRLSLTNLSWHSRFYNAAVCPSLLTSQEAHSSTALGCCDYQMLLAYMPFALPSPSLVFPPAACCRDAVLESYTR